MSRMTRDAASRDNGLVEQRAEISRRILAGLWHLLASNSSYARPPPEGGVAMSEKTLYERLGGYDAIASMANDLLPRMQADAQLSRFYQHRGEDGLRRSRQLLIDFLCVNAGGALYYSGRDMKVTHKGMKISESDWSKFLGHLNATLESLQIPPVERGEVVALMQSTKPDIVEA